MRLYLSLLTLCALVISLVAAQTPIASRTANTETAEIVTVSPTETTQSTATTSDSRSANTDVSGPTTVSPSTTTQSTATSSDSRTANTIVSGPTTVTDASTAAGQGQTESAFAAPSGRPLGYVGAAVVLGVGMAL